MEGNQPPVVTIESLQAQLETERTAHAATQAALTAAMDTHTNAQGAVDTAAETIAQATQIIDGQKETIRELESRLTALQTTPTAFPVMEVNKVKYEVQAKTFSYKGQVYTVEQLLKDSKLQKELVGIGVGFLVKQEG